MLTFGEAKRLHKEMWNWIARGRRSERNKLNWPKRALYDWLIKNYNYCFACVIADVHTRYANRVSCKECPIEWPDGVFCWEGEPGKEGREGLFYKWDNELILTEKNRLARQIANLPWKDRNKVKKGKIGGNRNGK